MHIIVAHYYDLTAPVGRRHNKCYFPKSQSGPLWFYSVVLCKTSSSNASLDFTSQDSVLGPLQFNTVI